MEYSVEIPQKTKNRITICSSNPTPGHTSRQNSNSKRYVHPYVHSSTIHKSETWTQSKYSLADEQLTKVWCIHMMEYHAAIKENEIIPFAATWMQLEIIILSEVSQTERQILYDITYMWNLKYDTL